MDKIVKGSNKKYYSLLILDVILILLDIVLFSFSVISLIVFLISIVCMLGILVAIIVSIIKNKKKKIQKVDPKHTNIIITDQDIIDLYNKAGIPVIYDEEGKIKDIFQLLGLEVKYDEFGNRITTIYERLKIVPRFTKEGKEVPTFLTIKNRVKGFVKPEKETGALTRTLTDEEKEELLLRQMLERKLQESEANGDTKKTKVIQKVMDQKKKEKQEAPKKDGYMKLSSGKAIAAPKPGKPKVKPYGYNPFIDIKNIFTINVPSIKSTVIRFKPTIKDEEIKVVPGFSLKADEPEVKPSNSPKPPVVQVRPKSSFLGKLTKHDSISTSTGLDANVIEK